MPKFRLSAAVVLALTPAHLQAAVEPVQAGGGAFAPSDAKDCHTDIVYLNQLFGWQVSWPREWRTLSSASEADVRTAIERWHTAAAALDAARAALAKTGSGPGAAPRVIVGRVVEQVSGLRSSLQQGPPPLADSIPPALREQWRALFADEILPSVQRYESFLKDQYRPSSGPPGLVATRDGQQCFRELVQSFTSIDLPPQEIERKGWALLNQTERDMAKLNGITPARLPAFLKRLRAPASKPFTSAMLVQRMERALVKAKRALPRLFDRPLIQDLRIEPLPKEMESSFPAGFYRSAEPGQAAAVVINLSRPADRELMAEVIAFHEGVPGHHLAHALGFPGGEFNSGFLEGWALYSEYLADEAGLYSTKRDRTGMMAKHLWAASRLVVEPGLHVHGWTREQAVAFMRKHTVLSDAEISLEVDRYLAMPGQSLSYMLGYDRIAAARRYAKAELGPAFDLRKFHTIVLSKGSRSLDVMQSDVVAWVTTMKTRHAASAASWNFDPRASLSATGTRS